MEYKIYMDVSGDIAPALAEAGNLKYVPMEYSIGGEMHKSTSIESEELLHTFYEGQRNGDLTQTSQISPYLYESYFKEDMAAGNSILYLCLSSGLSSTYQSANLAKENLKDEYPDVDLFVLDTLGATAGGGILAQRAMANQAKGMSIEDNYADLAELRTKIQYWFAVPDLMYLKRGGRIGAASAAIGSALNIHPILKIDEEGKLVITEKKRGKKAAVAAILKQFREKYDPNCDCAAYVINADDKEVAAQLQAAVLADYPDADIRITGLTPIIGAHTGPGMFALCFVGK